MGNRKKIGKEKLFSYAPYAGLFLVILFYVCVMDAKEIPIDIVRIRSIVGNIIMTALVSIGAVYAFSCGAIDMSMSGSVCLAAISGALAGRAANSLAVTIIVCMAAAIVLGALKGFLAVNMHVPAFIVTIVAGSIFSALASVMMGSETMIGMSSVFSTKSGTVEWIGLAILTVFYIAALVLFNYTAFGKSTRLMGGNPRSAAQSGIKTDRMLILAFIIGGIAIGLAAIFVILQTKTVSQTTGAKLGNDMMVAVVLGGMPISGGSKSKISAAVIGASTITILNTTLTILGLTVGSIQIVRGLLFLLVVFVTSMAYRGKLLPR